ncbi:hypothetical protein [Pedobacter sp. BMA]|uniref:hypothetical protein n=1 Tax=Pedobacter sp. BMA TaxID=1663685 RepID=UPI00064A67A0|nr:hypothetical protein [Pedobacter sp. BMA]KLT63917.1 hypothetical protein AB669_19500 [Pedobacter sp. BMA]
MRAILSKLKAFVKEVRSGAEPATSNSETIFDGFTIQLQAHELAFYDEVDGLICSKQRGERVQRKMLQYQQHCTMFMDQLFYKIKDDGQTTERNDVMKSLSRMIDYLKNNYPHYFSMDGLVPLIELEDRLINLKSQHQVLFAGLRKRKVNEEIEKIFSTFYNGQFSRKKVSYRELDYLEKMQASLIKFLHQVSNSPLERLLVGHLIYLNFNHRSFTACVAELMQNEASQKQNEKEQYRFWCALERDLNSFEDVNLMGFYPGSLSARMQLLNFVNAEIVYFHRKADATPTKAALPGVVESSFRVKIALSTAGLAYLIRLFIETAVVEANPRSALLRFICRHVETAGIGDELISANSLGTKYKQVVQSTALVVYRLLKRMVRAVEVQFPGVVG